MHIPKKFLFLVKMAMSVGFISWLFFRVEWSEVAQYILDVQGVPLFFYGVLLLLGMLISARKWQIIAREKEFFGPFHDFFRAYLTGTFINNFLPSTIGGDTYRTLWLGRRDGKLSPALSTTVFDRFTGLWALMVFTLLFSLVHISLVLDHLDWLLLVVIIVCSLLLDLVFPWLQRILWLRRFFQWVPERIHRLFAEIQTLARGKILFRSLGYALMFNFIGVGLANLVLFYALGGDMRPLDYLGVIFIASIISSIPISINNIGLKEWAYVTFFAYLGVGAEIAIAVAITSRFIQMIVSFFAIPFYLRSRDLLGREVVGK